ncbi:unnamed protein product [Closterium sp. Naga37s-1]|nr:unnamed protein product [Closterium sp. Naga37s-1]
MVVENGSTYTPDRHPSWFKVPLLQSQLACCCEWAFFLDSDAYMRMHHHTLSIPAWIHTINQPNYFNWLLRDNLTDSLEGQVWLPQDPALLLQPPSALHPEGGPVALIPRNGDSRDGYYGDVGMVFRRDSDYINAGVMLWRRSPATFKVGGWSGLVVQRAEGRVERGQPRVGGVKPQPGVGGVKPQAGVGGVKPQAGGTEQQGEYHLFSHVWEQHRLNQVARWPQWRRRVLMVPFRELTGPQGAMVRHLWGGVASEERDRVVYEALEEALGSLK